jgi:hypothetical protein
MIGEGNRDIQERQCSSTISRFTEVNFLYKYFALEEEDLAMVQVMPTFDCLHLILSSFLYHLQRFDL